MASRLSQLKKKRGNNLKELQQKLENSSGSGRPRDERIWKPKFDKDKGKGSCTVRFLPAKEGDEFVEVMSYSFNGPGGNYYDLALQTIGEKDPVQIAAINMFRKAKTEDDKKLYNEAKKLLPKRKYYANVYIVKDGEVPENEGKVFIWEFGPAIFKKIKEVIQPEFEEDDEPMDPFDLWTGAELKIRMVGTEIPDSRTGKMITVPNYDKTTFDDPSEFMDGDEDKLEEIVEMTHDLSEFIDPEKFKSPKEVADRFKKVTGKDYRHYDPEFVGEHIEEEEQEEKLEEEQDNDTGVDKHRPKEEPENEEQEQESEGDDEKDEEEEDDPVARFRKLAGQNKD